MNDFEISPSALNPSTIIAGLTATISTCIMGIFIFPKIYALYLAFPQEPIASQIILPVSITAIAIWIVFILVLISSLGRKIEVSGKLVYFKKKSALGFGHWGIDKIIDLSQVAWIKDRKKATYVSTGKTMIPIMLYWLVFEMKNGSKQELFLNGWDVSGVKNLFYFIRGKFSDIRFNTFILKDSPEKISGLDEYLKQQRET